MAGNPRWQGFPPTVQRGESVGIFLRFRDPTWMHKKMALWHGGNSVVGLYLAYEYWFHGLRGWQLIGGVLAAWCVLWWLAVSRLTWCRREIWFTPREILYRRGNRLKWHRFNRYLPHGFRMERFHLPQKPGEAPLREEAYHLFFDHLQGAIWIGDLWDKRQGELLLSRLINVSEWYRHRYRSEQPLGKPYEQAPSSTFAMR